jgi:DNA-binding transcriptional regulator GbsR (MarR family)
MVQELSPAQRKFILHWGEMGTRWGVNRTVAQIHALLYISPQPLNAEDIASRLQVARSNVSTSLKELQGWGIVRLIHLPDDKRDHFESLPDVWEMFRVVIEERKRREIDPTVRVLAECIAEAGQDKKADPYTRRQLEGLLGFFQTSLALYAEVRHWPTPALIKLLTGADRLRKLIGLRLPTLQRSK